MKRGIVVAVTAALLLTGCASRTEYGECVGLNGTENPKLEYRYSTRNIVLAALFWQTLVVPIIVVLDGLRCPVAEKAATAK